MSDKLSKHEKATIIGVALGFTVGIASATGIVYILIHFLVKYW
jgi:hypothetical protein